MVDLNKRWFCDDASHWTLACSDINEFFTCNENDFWNKCFKGWDIELTCWGSIRVILKWKEPYEARIYQMSDRDMASLRVYLKNNYADCDYLTSEEFNHLDEVKQEAYLGRTTWSKKPNCVIEALPPKCLHEKINNILNNDGIVGYATYDAITDKIEVGTEIKALSEIVGYATHDVGAGELVELESFKRSEEKEEDQKVHINNSPFRHPEITLDHFKSILQEEGLIKVLYVAEKNDIKPIEQGEFLDWFGGAKVDNIVFHPYMSTGKVLIETQKGPIILLGKKWVLQGLYTIWRDLISEVW